MSLKGFVCCILSVQICVALLGCVEGILDEPAAPVPNPPQSTSSTNVNKDSLKYCGSEILPPWRKVVCERFCEDGTCHNFYCECKRLPSTEKNCTGASETGKCSKYCEKSNFGTALHCPSPSGKSYCVCS